ncbi:unnamed protein product [Schistosoma turkestanicum]|nr:unnamed protein product [Schistosoma turkestanicum]
MLPMFKAEKTMIRPVISSDSNNVLFEEDSSLGYFMFNSPTSTLSKDHQNHSPRPSLGSFGSEIRCSIDQLDAVIAAYDIHHHPNDNGSDDFRTTAQQLFHSPLLNNNTSTLTHTTTNNKTVIHSMEQHVNYSTFMHSPSLSNQMSCLFYTNDNNNNNNHWKLNKTLTTTTANRNQPASFATTNNGVSHMNEMKTFHANHDYPLHENHNHHHHEYGIGASSYSSLPVTSTSLLMSNNNNNNYSNDYNDIEPSFPSPPLDTFTSENFPLPPPPPPPPSSSPPSSSSSSMPMTLSTNPVSTTFSSFTTNVNTKLTPQQQQNNDDVAGSKHVQSIPSHVEYSKHQLYDPKYQTESLSNSYHVNNNDEQTTVQYRHQITTNARKPSIPQRAPSTRLTSLPNWPNHYDDTDILNCDTTMKTSHVTLTVHNGTHDLQTKHSLELSKENTDHSSNSNSSNNINNNNDSHSIVCTTLPVQDIIRKFGNLLTSNAKISNQCQITSNVQNIQPSTIRPNSFTNCNTNNNNHHYPIKIPITHQHHQPTLTTNANDSPSTVNNLVVTSGTLNSQQHYHKVQEVLSPSSSSTSTSSPSLSSRNSNQCNPSNIVNQSYQMVMMTKNLSNGNNDYHYCTKYNHDTSVNNTMHPSLSAPITNTTTTATNSSSMCHSYKSSLNMNDKCSKPMNSSYQPTASSTFIPVQQHQTNSPCTTFTSSGGIDVGILPNNELSKQSNHNHSSHLTTVIHHHPVQSQPIKQNHPVNSNVVVNQQSSDTSSNSSSFVDIIQSMNLSAQTLAIFNEFNIVDANQIPGYHPISSGLPDWKIHQLKRKNQDAANSYADELKKWGLVPNWKRELIEKKQLLNKMQHETPTCCSSSSSSISHHHQQQLSSNGHTSSMHNTHQSSSSSLASAELAEKLQRRLDKVSKSTN